MTTKPLVDTCRICMVHPGEFHMQHCEAEGEVHDTSIPKHLELCYPDDPPAWMPEDRD